MSLPSEAPQLEQQTEHWLQWRKGRIGSSDACIIMQSTDWSTPRELYFDKTGTNPRKKKRSSSHVMELGNEFEPKARALYELQHGLDFRPTILVDMKHPWRVASLDGFNSEGKRIILEIKCVQSDVFDYAQRGECPPKYKPQVQHQLDVAKADECHFFVCKIGRKHGKYGDWEIKDTALAIIYPDVEYQKELLMAELSFYDFMVKRIPPPLTNRDYYMVEHDDQSTVLLFSRLKQAKLKLQELEKAEAASLLSIAVIHEQKAEAQRTFEEIKEEAIEHVEAEIRHPKVSCIGINMSKDKNDRWSVRLEASEPVELLNHSTMG